MHNNLTFPFRVPIMFSWTNSIRIFINFVLIAFVKILSIIWNINCNFYFSRYSMCIDVNECTKKFDLCDNKSETCINLPGHHKCICRWGFQWSTEQQICIPDMLVKSAEIRLVIGIHYLWSIIIIPCDSTQSIIYYFKHIA